MSDGAGLASFFIGEASHASPDGEVRAPDEVVRPGDRYRWRFLHGFELQGSFTAVERDRLVAFTFGPMTVTVTLREVDDAVEIDLHQAGCAREDPQRAWDHLNCRSCWILFLMNLRSQLRGGPDLRDHDRPAWNDSVSIGFDAV